MDVGESLATAVIREAEEETGLRIRPANLHFLGISDNPGRDPRRQTVALAWWAVAEPGQPHAADDVKQVEVHPFSSLRAVEMVFDHKNIVNKYLEAKERKAAGSPNLPPTTFVTSLDAMEGLS